MMFCLLLLFSLVSAWDASDASFFITNSSLDAQWCQTLKLTDIDANLVKKIVKYCSNYPVFPALLREINGNELVAVGMYQAAYDGNLKAFLDLKKANYNDVYDEVATRVYEAAAYGGKTGVLLALKGLRFNLPRESYALVRAVEGGNIDSVKYLVPMVDCTYMNWQAFIVAGRLDRYQAGEVMNENCVSESGEHVKFPFQIILSALDEAGNEGSLNFIKKFGGMAMFELPQVWSTLALIVKQTIANNRKALFKYLLDIDPANDFYTAQAYRPSVFSVASLLQMIEKSNVDFIGMVWVKYKMKYERSAVLRHNFCSALIGAVIQRNLVATKFLGDKGLMFDCPAGQPVLATAIRVGSLKIVKALTENVEYNGDKGDLIALSSVALVHPDLYVYSYQLIEKWDPSSELPCVMVKKAIVAEKFEILSSLVKLDAHKKCEDFYSMSDELYNKVKQHLRSSS